MMTYLNFIQMKDCCSLTVLFYYFLSCVHEGGVEIPGSTQIKGARV